MTTSSVETRRPALPRRSAGRTAAWAAGIGVIGLGILDLAVREIARRPVLAAFNDTTIAAVVAAVVGTGIAILLAGRPAQPSPHVSDRVVSLALAGACALGLVAQVRLGARLQSDGFYYFAYARSLWFDRDVDFTNDYRLLGLGDKAHLFQPTPTAHAQSAWTIGPAIAWAPFFAAGHVVATRLSAGGADVKTDGTSYPYRQAVCVAGLFYGLIGLWFCYRLAALFFSRALAASAMVLMASGSFLLWYLVKEPSMTHAPSMAAVAAFTYAWARTRGRRSLAAWILLGLGAGLMTTIRWQNALFALLPAIDVLYALADARTARSREPAARTVAGGLGFTVAAVVGFLPQMLAWNAIYGQFLAISPVGPQIRWSDPHIVDILWSSRNGLFSVSPVLYLAAAGLAGFLRAERRFAVAALVTCAAMVYFNASIQDWWGSAGFGMRRFDGTLPLLTVGLAVSLRWLVGAVGRRPGVAVAGALSLLVLWNVTFMAAAVSGTVRIGQAVSFGQVGGEQVRIAHRWIGYPFSYPVNLIYAIRNGVSPARYDLLGVNRFLSDPLRPYGKVDLGFDDEAMIEEGWHAAERAGDTTFRWTGARANLLVPLDYAADLTVQVRLMPFSPPGTAPQQIWIQINAARHGPFTLAPGWQDVRFEAGRGEWRAGLNRVSFDSARAVRPVDAGAGGDTRLLGTAVDYLRVQVANQAR